MATLRFLAVHAHPDDEVIATGATFARYAAEGVHTALVCCTRGEEGEIHDPDLDPSEAAPRLGAIREGELRASAAILGIADVRLLGYRDSGMAGTAANADPRSFVNADPQAAAGRLAAILREVRPHVVVTYDPNGGYGHPDHKMAHRVTRLAIEQAAQGGDGGAGWAVPKLYYTAIALSTLLQVNAQMRARGLVVPFDEQNPDRDIRQFAAPDEVITARIDVRGTYDQVWSALRAHRTQIPGDDVLMRLPRDIAEDAFACDSYIRAFTAVEAPAIETDLFDGLR